MPCHCLSLTLHNLILGSFLFWSIKALIQFKEEHNNARGILKALLAMQSLLFSSCWIFDFLYFPSIYIQLTIYNSHYYHVFVNRVENSADYDLDLYCLQNSMMPG